MRRSEKPDAQSCRAINTFQHGARRTFPVRAGDMDEAEFFLRVADERGERARAFQSKICGQKTCSGP